jgi:hypothetical protein
LGIWRCARVRLGTALLQAGRRGLCFSCFFGQALHGIMPAGMTMLECAASSVCLLAKCSKEQHSQKTSVVVLLSHSFPRRDKR